MAEVIRVNSSSEYVLDGYDFIRLVRKYMGEDAAEYVWGILEENDDEICRLERENDELERCIEDLQMQLNAARGGFDEQPGFWYEI